MIEKQAPIFLAQCFDPYRDREQIREEVMKDYYNLAKDYDCYNNSYIEWDAVEMGEHYPDLCDYLTERQAERCIILVWW
jgi:hypothetical protein